MTKVSSSRRKKYSLAHLRRFRAAEGWKSYSPMDRLESGRELRMKEVLMSPILDAEERYNHLFQYFLRGYVQFANPTFERVNYPGMGSVHGYRMNGLEGFARTSPLFAAWIYSGRGTVVTDYDSGTTADLVAFLKNGILAGTDATSATYWGTMTNFDQRIVETADIARVLWLTRQQIWDGLSNSEKKQVADWLLQVNHVMAYKSNWLLFPVVVNYCLGALGYQDIKPDRRYYEFKKYYLGHGWFFDPPEGIDFYNCWGITYDVSWIHLLQPEFDHDFIVKALAQSAELTSHLIGPKGIPIMGRSVCYRTAVPVPVIARTLVDDAAEVQGLGRRAMDTTWRYFVAHGCLRNGALTQGYFNSDPRFVDRYTGTGSAHWGLRSLVLAFMHPQGGPFWTTAEKPLPIEVADYRLDLPELGWQVEGNRESGEIVIHIPSNSRPVIVPEPYSILRRIGEKVLRRPLRPRNHPIKYESSEYSSLKPFPAIFPPKTA
jgi:hypothetical protein